MSVAAPTVGPVAGKPPLDDVMLAMDVVDTLRRRQQLVERELDEEGRELDLKERLRKIYSAQGIEVPDHILEEGVAGLKEDRFLYKPPERGLATRLAHLYVRRRVWGRWVLAGVAVLGIGWGVHYATVVAPRAALPGELAALHQSVVAEAQVDSARERAGSYLARGQSALREGDAKGARAMLEALEDLRATLEQEYTLRIVSRPGEQSGFWRVPDDNPKARNYYLVVEALDARGAPVTVRVTNEETGKPERVSKWGLRVAEAEFRRVAADKKDDGIIQNNRFGVKRRGQLEPDYEVPTTGAAVTQW
jgi:hypothetical protein